MLMQGSSSTDLRTNQDRLKHAAVHLVRLHMVQRNTTFLGGQVVSCVKRPVVSGALHMAQY